jgi:hypothetical protein
LQQPHQITMEIETVCAELAVAFVLVCTVTPRVLVFRMIEISVRMKTLEKSVGRTTIRLASMKIGEQQQVNSRLSPIGEKNVRKKNAMFNTLT